jgi:tRNA modification GTPase
VLAKREAAIVTSEPGTTRDIIEVNLTIGGFPVLVSDTAGIRKTEGLVEKEGIKRAVARLNSADLILWLEDGEIPSKDTSVLSSLETRNSSIPLWRILSKGDLVPNSLKNTPQTFDLVISAKTDRGIAELISRLEALLASDEAQQSAPLITRARHRREVLVAQSSLSAFLNGSMEDSELRAEDLRQVALILKNCSAYLENFASASDDAKKGAINTQIPLSV